MNKQYAKQSHNDDDEQLMRNIQWPGTYIKSQCCEFSQTVFTRISAGLSTKNTLANMSHQQITGSRSFWLYVALVAALLQCQLVCSQYSGYPYYGIGGSASAGSAYGMFGNGYGYGYGYPPYYSYPGYGYTYPGYGYGGGSLGGGGAYGYPTYGYPTYNYGGYPYAGTMFWTCFLL
ncbi:uncharacterized protein LOC108651214 isoform X2 [Drosophila navojoa]|uniref:uncharacterized protein LOC108651214 isoform X2 n=1 Tax=Drosophila navojoa TaxID=7232 RepID=UPI000846789D|nr:uncharacterized protein LOC108651214 isoform X2 [Drosophila navojoa]